MAYRNGPKIITDGLVLCLDAAATKSYPGSGTTWTDVSTSKTNITLSANSTYTSSKGGGIAFDGASDYGYKTGLSYTPYCMEVWFHNDIDITKDFKPGGGYEQILGFGGNSGGIACRAWTSGMTDETIGFWTPNYQTNGATYIKDNVYIGDHNLIFNWNGSTYDIWLDGIKRTTYAFMLGGTTPTDAALVSMNSIYLGRDTATYNYYFNGTIYRLAIYGSQLSDDQVLQNFNSTRGRFGIGSPVNPVKHSSEILASNPSASDGVYWFDVGYGAFPVYCDMTNGGWMLVASNNASSTVIPGGTSRNNAAYRLDRNGTVGQIGTPDPDSDYIMGQSIQNLQFGSVRIYGFGRTYINGTYTWGGSQGSTITATWNLSTTGDSRFTEIVPAANVTFGGNTTRHPNAAYYILDAVRNDISFNANSNQSTVGAAGVANANGDPSNGTYLGHGGTEGSYEGWYISGSSYADSQGYTTWVK